MAKKKQVAQVASPSKKRAEDNTKNTSDFLRYLWSAENRIELLSVLAMQIALFIFLKIRFPYPLTESDSGNYILSATTGKINGYRPYGYSAFLRFFHSFSENIQFIVTWQYLLTAVSVFLLLFTLRYYFRIHRARFLLLSVLLIFNPSILFLNAYIMSDGLFVALTALWLTSGIALLFGGVWWLVIPHFLLLYWSIDTRYIGMFYPLFTAVILAWRFWKNKPLAIAGIILPFALLFWYRAEQTELMKEEFGVETFSAFGGWQKANNAVAVLPYVKVDEQAISDPQIKSVHQIVRAFPDSMFKFSDISATSFMWVNDYPGKAFLRQFIMQTGTPYLRAWAYCGTLMEKYGNYLESNYRSEYVKYYMLPNAKDIFTVWDIAENKTFFADQNTKNFFKTDVETYEYGEPILKPLLPYRKIADVVLWVLWGVSLVVGLILLRKLSLSLSQKLAIAFLVGWLLAFLAVSVYAAPINNFRYIMPIYYVQVLLPFLIFANFRNNTKP